MRSLIPFMLLAAGGPLMAQSAIQPVSPSRSRIAQVQDRREPS